MKQKTKKQAQLIIKQFEYISAMAQLYLTFALLKRCNATDGSGLVKISKEARKQAIENAIHALKILKKI